MDNEVEVSWRAIGAHAPVIASGGDEVGHVLDVASLPSEDIFHGVVFRHHLTDTPRMASASSVQRITNRAIYLSVDSAEAAGFEAFHTQHVERLGLVGHFFWKHLGWRETRE